MRESLLRRKILGGLRPAVAAGPTRLWAGCQRLVSTNGVLSGWCDRENAVAVKKHGVSAATGTYPKTYVSGGL